MYKIVRRENLNSTVTLFEVEAPDIAKRCKPGQFIILRVDEFGERIPLTIASYDAEKGTNTIIFQVVGLSTRKLNALQTGDYILDFVGPLGKPSDIEGLKKVCIVVGGVGSAIGYPLARELKRCGAYVDTVLGFRTKDLIILEDDFHKISNNLYLVTDDGSAGQKGLVTDVLKELLKTEKYDVVYAIGPLVMMKYVALLGKEYEQRTIVSMNPIMIDGTGMCGGCRLTINGEIKFACVDGPEFDAFGIDFDEAIQRSKIYQKEEREADCRLGV
jgi:ferredoxin--NADP+ reductase